MSLCTESIERYGSEANFVYKDRKCWNCDKMGWTGVFESNENISSVTILCSECGKKKFTNYCSAEQLSRMKRIQIREHIKDTYPGRYHHILEKHCGGDPEKFDAQKFTVW